MRHEDPSRVGRNDRATGERSAIRVIASLRALQAGADLVAQHVAFQGRLDDVVVGFVVECLDDADDGSEETDKS